MPIIQGRHIQMSSWIVGGFPGGLAFRESKDHKFADGSPFLPHYINHAKVTNLTFTMSKKVLDIFN
jgi:glutathionylspermidine synthase